jgi:acyl-lipid omega-6 desaturase (Delta-12 desaturase)
MTLSIEPKSATALPQNLKLKDIINSLPKEIFAKDGRKAWQQALTTIVTVSLGMYAISVSPWFLLPFAWIFTGTAMTGCFVIGHDCAHRSFSNSRKVNDIVGHLFMLTLIYPFHGWRYGHAKHHKHTNKMDVDNAWQPWRPEAYAEAPTWLQVVYQAMRGRLWWMASFPHWAAVHFDWRKFPEGKTRADVKFSALFVIIGAAVIFPILITTLGFVGFVKFWVVPWVVYHFWMSTFTIVHHTASDIPFNPADEWDEAIAQLAGTVHCEYPRWVEFLCHDINVHIPHHISTAIPSYKLREAHAIIKENWAEYLQERGQSLKERKFNWELMQDITDNCHIYEENEFYQSFAEFNARN